MVMLFNLYSPLSVTQGLIELTPAGVINSGVSILRDSVAGQIKARKLVYDAGIADTVLGSVWVCIGAVFSNASVKLYSAGALVATNNDGNNVPASSVLSVGCLGQASPTLAMNGGLCEIFIGNGVYSDTNMLNISNYMRRRIGLI